MRSAQLTISPSTVPGAGRDQEWLRIPSRVSAHRFSPVSTTSAPHGPCSYPSEMNVSNASSLAWPPGPWPQSWPRAMASARRDVDPGRPGDRGGDLGHLQGVGQPGPLVVAGVDHDLGLAGQPAKGGGVHDPVPVPLEAGALLVRRLRLGPVDRRPRPGWRRVASSRVPAAPEARGAPAAPARRSPPSCVGADQIPRRVPAHGLGPGLRPGGHPVSHRRCPARRRPGPGRDRTCRRASPPAGPP